MLERTVLRLLHEQEDEMAGNLALHGPPTTTLITSSLLHAASFYSCAKGCGKESIATET